MAETIAEIQKRTDLDRRGAEIMRAEQLSRERPALLRQNFNLPFSNRTKAEQAKLDAAVLAFLESSTWTISIGGVPLFLACTRSDIAVGITVGMSGVTHATIDQIAPMVTASCKRLVTRGLVSEGARKYTRAGRPCEVCRAPSDVGFVEGPARCASHQG